MLSYQDRETGYTVRRLPGPLQGLHARGSGGLVKVTPARFTQIATRILAGDSAVEIKRTCHTNDRTERKIRRLVLAAVAARGQAPPQRPCACGRAHGHVGPCRRLAPCVCRRCARAFQPRSRPRTFCSRACSVAALNAAPRPMLAPKACKACGQLFQPDLARRTFCSRRCKSRVQVAEGRAPGLWRGRRRAAA